MSDSPSPQPETEPLTRVQVLIAMGVTAVVLLLVARLWMAIDRVPLLPVAFDSTSLLVGVALGLGITAASAIAYRLWSAYRTSADYYLNLVLKPLALPDLIWLGLLPGLSEELLFRGVMLPAFGLNLLGVAATSLCFGIMHFSGSKNWAYIVWATVIGFILGLSAMQTGNLTVPILAHITTNLVSSYLWKANVVKL